MYFLSLARSNGVFEREGHTEGSVDLMRLAGLSPYAVLCELMNDDGTMSRLPELSKFGEIHKLPIVTILDIKKYRTKVKNMK